MTKKKLGPPLYIYIFSSKYKNQSRPESIYQAFSFMRPEYNHIYMTGTNL